MKRPAQLAILVFGLLALLALVPAAEAEPPSQRSLAQVANNSRDSAPAQRVQPLPSFAPLAGPSGIKHGLSRLRWLILAIVGTAVVFFTAFGSRRLYALSATTRSGTRRKAPQEHVTSRAAPNGAMGPDLSRRRCLLPGCHHEDHLPVGRRSG